MRLKFTPLNIITAVFFAAIAYFFLVDVNPGTKPLPILPAFVLAILSSVSDIFFRIYIKSIKRIWIVEMAFIIFAAVSILLIRSFYPFG